eukprot:COSAG01_NODE_15251_length_1357_cov_2.023847_3_plen_112_part_00
MPAAWLIVPSIDLRCCGCDAAAALYIIYYTYWLALRPRRHTMHSTLALPTLLDIFLLVSLMSLIGSLPRRVCAPYLCVCNAGSCLRSLQALDRHLPVAKLGHTSTKSAASR